MAASGTGSRFASVEAIDLRFPTSLQLDGSDAMHHDPDYSATYVILRTDADDGLEGHGFTFTIGRGNEVCVAAVNAIAPLVVGRSVDGVLDDLGSFWKAVTGDSQLRWIGPEKGVIHLATAAVVNAVWDLRAKREGKPLWRVLCDMTPEELAALIDYRYITDEIREEWVIDRLRATRPRRQERESALRSSGLPAYTTSAGWLGYGDDKLRELCREAVADGWSHIKMKVGRDLADDLRRAAIIREEIGAERALMMDANQVWDVEQAIDWTLALGRFDPLWMEEPTSPDDILGHARIARAIDPIGVATGEHVHNRVMFKQLLQADAIRYCQIDSARLGGVNEVLSVLFMAAKRGVTVCPHAGGVGLCEYVQHLALFDAIAVAPDVTDRVVEYVDHLHEHFAEPVRILAAAYVVPDAPGYSADILPESRERYRFPDGPAWSSRT
jgi:L-fuconate dehydratase